MQARLDVAGASSGAGWAHLVSRDLATWRELPPALVPRGDVVAYFSGSVTIVDGVPVIILPINRARGGTITDPGQDLGISRPLNLSDPWLVEWSVPEVVIRYSDSKVGHPLNSHSPVFEDPSQFFEDPAVPGRLLFVHQTSTTSNRQYMQQWANTSADLTSWESLGDFFPGSGSCDPMYVPATGAQPAIFYACNNVAWLGRTVNNRFTPTTPLLYYDTSQFAGGWETSALKGFRDERSSRYITWLWVHSGCDGSNKAVSHCEVNPDWDGLLTVPRVMTVDTDLGLLRFLPVAEE